MYVAELKTRKYRGRKPPAVTRPEQVARLVRKSVSDPKREHFFVLLLTTRHVVLGIETVSVGSLNASIVHPREVFRPAINAAAAAIILAHNHPSGDVAPSDDDMEITNRLADAGKLLGIDVLDHVIVAGDSAYLSFRERGLLDPSTI